MERVTHGPWVAHYNGVYGGELSGLVVAICYHPDNSPGADLAANANAAFIVLAANNHDSLLAALRAAHTRFGQMWPDREPDSDETWAMVDAAVKRAEGG